MRTLGLRVRSGFAIAVAVEAAAHSWRVQDCCRVPLAEEAGKYARFPYHPLLELAVDQGVLQSRRAVSDVRRVARRELGALLRAGRPIDAAAIVGGSLTDPKAIANPHIRAHAREGELFRSVIAAALKRARVACVVLSDRDVLAQAAAKLDWTQPRVSRVLSGSGRGRFRPWGADEKLALLGALWQVAEADRSIFDSH